MSKTNKIFIHVEGAREHNLKSINLDIPRNKLVVITGLSGSGKSSLAFDTLYAEGQRRYMETFSSYVRQYMGELKRPDVDKITGLSPVISIEQKSVSHNPRSTVGTVTEIYDFLRLLYARVSDAYSYLTGNKMVRHTEEQLIEIIFSKFKQQKIDIYAPIVKGRKGHYKELLEKYRKKGFMKARVDGEIITLEPGLSLSRYKIHDIEILIDRLEVTEKNKTRLKQSIRLALKEGDDSLLVIENQNGAKNYYSKNLMDPETGLSYPEPNPNTFSFNSPYGACPSCNGLGTEYQIDPSTLIINPEKSIKEGGILILDPRKESWIAGILRAIALKFNTSLDTPVKNLPEKMLNTIFYGSSEPLLVVTPFIEYETRFEGLVKKYKSYLEEGDRTYPLEVLKEFIPLVKCQECQGYRLKKESYQFKILGKHIGELADMQLDKFYRWIKKVPQNLEGHKQIIAEELVREISIRTQFLLDIGLNYLSLNRPVRTLSGGESQRIRLATQIGSRLVNVAYIIDEPSIGLHQRDNHRLIHSLKKLSRLGNSVIVVEHDREMMMEADYLVDLGPGAGNNGGKVCFAGTLDQINGQSSLTTDYLTGKKTIPVPGKRRPGNGKFIKLTGATGHNLKNITLTIPLGKLICVTGVSGSGKSSLINETLYPIIRKHFYRSKENPLPYKEIIGLENIDKVIEIDQSPIGRTPRSNPATYSGLFTQIRNLFSQLPEARIRGFKPGRFSFNVKGGRCEECQGAGIKTIEMNFLPNVYITCPSCQGKRYNRETLEVRYRGKSINDVLNMTVNEALEFFENIPQIKRKVKAFYDVGMGYVALGQSSTTLSGGEAQRVKLATELSKRDTGNTLFILDEPTTGLHFEDIKMLMNVLNKFVDKGNTVLIIEHNLDVIKQADHIIDMGPEGGARGGKIIFEGTPEELVSYGKTFTAQFLKNELK